MKSGLVAHRPSELPDPANRYPQAIASAIRWLGRQPEEEMVGDDSVGWWLLMETGRYPPSRILSALASKLDTIARGAPLPSGVLYTFTSIARTLNRAGYPLEGFNEILPTWKKTMERASTATNDVNFIWLMQMAAELWPETAMAYRKPLHEVAMIKDSKLMIPAAAMVLLESLDFGVTKAQSLNLRRLFANATATGVIDEIPDWHLGYVLWALLASGDYETAGQLGRRLLEHQRDGAWDESSEECIESTSICGLAMLDLCSSQLKMTDWNLARSRASHDVVLLLDNHNWLLSNWAALEGTTEARLKGPALEQFVVEWVRLDDSLRLYGRDIRGGTDELDVVVDLSRNSSLSGILKQSQFALFECKNLSEPMSAKEIRAFRDSLRARRKDNCRLGVVLSSTGYTNDAKKTAIEDTGDDQMMVLLDGGVVKDALRKRIQISELLFTGLQDRIIRRP